MTAGKLTAIEHNSTNISVELHLIQSEVTAINQPLLQIRDSLPTVQKAVESLGSRNAIEIENLSTKVLQGVQVLGEEVRDVRNSIGLPLTSQQEQLSRIERQNAVQLVQLDKIERLFKELQVTPNVRETNKEQEVHYTQLTVVCKFLTLVIDTCRKVDWSTCCEARKSTRDM